MKMKWKWKWKWKRPAAFLLAAAMIFTMSGVPASAVEALPLSQGDHTQCVCGGTAKVNSHEHDSDSIAWTATDSLPDSAGNYYLTQNVSGNWTVPDGEVSMDGGIALLASTDTYNIADRGININSNTLEQYNHATITGSSTTNVILVNGVEATITISDLDIQIPIDNNATTASNWIPAIRLANGAKLNLILEGKNTLKGGDMCAAIDVPEGCTLTISGEGSLKATGGVGAGIGASSMRKGSLGTIEINGGNIEAYGSGMAAGIGGGLEGGIGTIVI